MKKSLLSLVSMLVLVGCLNAQTTYLDFEGAIPNYEVFGGSNFSVVDNPSKTGVNTTDKVAMTQKGGGDIQTWGGNAFPVGGTLDFGPGAKTFTMDVWCAVAGTAMFKVEKNGTSTNVENPVDYTTPGEWQTITYTFTDLETNLYDKIVVFMGFGTTATDVWYYDNVKGVDITAGADVDVTFQITDQGGTATSVEVELSNDLGTKIPLDGTAGVGTVWTTTLTGVAGSTITVPITYSVYVNGALVPELTNLNFVMQGAVNPIIAKNYGQAPTGANLITNGTFDGIEGVLPVQTGNAWGSWSGNGGVITIEGGVATVTPVAAGDNWQMQLEQKNFGIENDKTYTVSFDAWADADRIIALTIEDPSNGYALLGTTEDPNGTLVDTELRSKWNIDITTEPITYKLTLAVDKVLANTLTKFAFLMAQTADVVYIDNVSLVEGTNVSVSTNRADAVKIYPNPAVNNLYISSKSEIRKVVIYNVVGKQVKEYSNVLQSVNVSDLKSGVYMIKTTDANGKSVTSKFMKR